MLTEKKKIKVYPTKIKDLICNKDVCPILFQKNPFGFYTKDCLILKNFHSSNLSEISVLDLQTMEKIRPINHIHLIDTKQNKVDIQYKEKWFEFDPKKHIVSIYENGQNKLFSYHLNELEEIKWYENTDLKNIVYVGNSAIFAEEMGMLLKSRYNLENEVCISFRYFTDILMALGYILHHKVEIVITETNLKHLSTKRFITRIRKTKNDIHFFVFTDQKIHSINNLNQYPFSDYYTMIDDLKKWI